MVEIRWKKCSNRAKKGGCVFLVNADFLSIRAVIFFLTPDYLRRLLGVGPKQLGDGQYPLGEVNFGDFFAWGLAWDGFAWGCEAGFFLISLRSSYPRFSRGLQSFLESESCGEALEKLHVARGD